MWTPHQTPALFSALYWLDEFPTEKNDMELKPYLQLASFLTLILLAPHRRKVYLNRVLKNIFWKPKPRNPKLLYIKIKQQRSKTRNIAFLILLGWRTLYNQHSEINLMVRIDTYLILQPTDGSKDEFFHLHFFLILFSQTIIYIATEMHSRMYS